MSWLHLLGAALTRRPLRTLLTAASLAAAFALLGLLLPMWVLFTGGAAKVDSDTRLVVQPRHSIADFLPVRYAQMIAGMLPGDGKGQAVAHLTWFGGTFRDPANAFPRWAVPPAEFLAALPELELSPRERQAFLSTRNGAIVGRATANRFGLKLGDSVVLTPDIWPHRDAAAWSFEIVGIFDARDRRVDRTAMYIDYAYFDAARAWGQGLVSVIVVRPGAADGNALAQRIDAAFANSADETTTATEQAYALAFANRLGDAGLMLAIVSSTVLLTIALVCVHTIAQGVRERRSEFATLRAIGFRRGQLAALVLAEAFALTVLGAIPGLAIAQGLAALAGDSLGQLAPNPLAPAPLAAAVSSVIAIALLSGVPPAWRLRRDDIVSALRAVAGG